MAIKPTRTVKVRSLADRLENAGVLLKRLSLKYCNDKKVHRVN